MATNPTKDKTWEYNINNLVLADSTQGSTTAHADKRNLLLGIKEAMTDGGLTAPWTVVSSSNGTTAGASDNWTDIDDLVWSTSDGGARGWIVLRQTGISTTFELLIDLRQGSINDDGGEIRMYVAQAGFTGGTTTARPTATDERILRDLDTWGAGGQGSSIPFKWHFQISDDGECTRVYIFNANATRTAIGFWIFDVPKNPTTGWTDPYIASVNGGNDTAEIPTYGAYQNTANIRGRFSGVDTTMYLSSESLNNIAVGNATTIDTFNQLDGTYIAGECGIDSLTSTFRGSHGTVFDLWWGFNFAVTGQTYPDDGSRAFAQFGDFIIPWNGDIMEVN